MDGLGTALFATQGILAALRQQLSARFGSECDIAVAKNAREALEKLAAAA